MTANPMKIVVFGATGTTGRLAVQKALDEGHAVTAFVRDPARLPMAHARLTVVAGDVMNAKQVGEAMVGQQGVICALGVLPTVAKDKARAQRSVPVCSEGTRHILQAMQTQGVPRIVVQSASSVGSSLRTGSWWSGRIVRMAMRDIMADKEIQERLVFESPVQWTIVRPVKLKDQPPSGNILAGEDIPWSLVSAISFADTAAYMVQVLTDAGTIGKTLTIKNP
jgi:putative NADH-flavin reductase